MARLKSEIEVPCPCCHAILVIDTNLGRVISHNEPDRGNKPELSDAQWGRRRLAYPIDRHREGSYHIILFESPPEALIELEHTLLITEEVIRHLVTRVERPAKTARPDGSDAEELDAAGDLPSGLDEDDDDRDGGEFIDESESEAAPAAID